MGYSDRVRPRSLTARLMMKNSAGFRRRLFLYETYSSVLLPTREQTPAEQMKHNRITMSQKHLKYFNYHKGLFFV